jgi:hypothetical protein
MMKLRHTNRIWIVSLIVAWALDLMFWKKEPGISLPIAVILILAGGLLLARWQGVRPAKTSYLLLIPILFFAVMLAVRQEPGTTMTNLMLGAGGMAVLAVTLLGGKWVWYSLTDYIVKFFQLAFGMLLNGLRLLFGKHTRIGETEADAEKETETEPAPEPAAPQPGGWRTYGMPVLRGVLLAVPVIALLAALLASADPIFSAGLQSVLDVFKLENLGEYIFRAFYILLFGYIFLGAYVHALVESRDEKLIGVDKPWLTPFLGIVEAGVILGAVDLLFATFVGVQFWYFFGGTANINLEGFTYAEYARRGFGELVSVSVISLLLFLGLSSITRREGSGQRCIFGGLGIALVSLVMVMLVSAFQRLILYETAYGFSTLRTYTHIFMIWLGLLLFATIVIEIIQRQRAFALMAVIAMVGFGLTLNILNVDALIVRQNVRLAQTGHPLDMNYLRTLTNDAVPQMVEEYTRADLSTAIKERLGVALACKASAYEDLTYRPLWVSYHLSEARAVQSLQTVSNQLPKLDLDEYGMTQVQGEDFYCSPQGFGMD